MSALLLLIGAFFLIQKPGAHLTKASLQASGLTCAMCSKAVKSALEKIDFVQTVDVDIKRQEYHISFKRNDKIDLDDLNKAVKDAGFSIASLKITGQFDKIEIFKDKLVKVGNQHFRLLNGDMLLLDGEKTLKVIDKHFLTPKEYKKFNSAIKLKTNANDRVYLVMAT